MWNTILILEIEKNVKRCNNKIYTLFIKILTKIQKINVESYYTNYAFSHLFFLHIYMKPRGRSMLSVGKLFFPRGLNNMLNSHLIWNKREIHPQNLHCEMFRLYNFGNYLLFTYPSWCNYFRKDSEKNRR